MAKPDKNKKFDYHFRCTSPEDYELDFMATVDDSYLTAIFEKSQKILMRNKGMKVEGDPALLKEFKIPPQYLQVVGVRMKKHVRQVLEEIRNDDDINATSVRIKGGTFQRNEFNNWDITIKYTGEYIDER